MKCAGIYMQYLSLCVWGPEILDSVNTVFFMIIHVPACCTILRFCRVCMHIHVFLTCIQYDRV